MAAKKNNNIDRRWSEEKISSAILIILIMLSAIMFVVFFSSGYNEPWEENTEFINPAHTDNLINFMFFIGGTACVAVFASMLWFARCRGHVLNVTGGIPAGKISAAVVSLLIISLIVTYVTSSNTAIIINGRSYNETSWLCLTDMFIHTTEILLGVAVLAVVYGMSGINRRIQKH